MGNSILTPEIFSRSSTQAMCDWSESIDTPIGCTLSRSQSFWRLANSMNSVEQTGVKSEGCENSITPLALGGVVGKANHAVGGFGLEVGCEFEDAGDAGFSHVVS